MIAADRTRRGDRLARQQVIESYLGLIASIAKDHTGRGVPFADLVQEGSLAVIVALDGGDRRRAFAPLASRAIRRAMKRAVARATPLPEDVLAHAPRVREAEARLAQELRRWPRPEEIAVELESSVALVEHARRAARPPRSRRRVPKAENAESTFEIAWRHERSAQLRRALNPLHTRERLILDLRFGLTEPPARTLDDVARLLSITPERVRQIEARALNKLHAVGHLHALHTAA